MSDKQTNLKPSEETSSPTSSQTESFHTAIESLADAIIQLRNQQNELRQALEQSTEEQMKLKDALKQSNEQQLGLRDFVVKVGCTAFTWELFKFILEGLLEHNYLNFFIRLVAALCAAFIPLFFTFGNNIENTWQLRRCWGTVIALPIVFIILVIVFIVREKKDEGGK